MTSLKVFDIDIYNLPNKEYDYQFDIDERFFVHFEDSIVDKGKVTVMLQVIRHLGTLEFNFKIKGTVVVLCDRSLDEYEQAIESEERLLLKYGEENTELSDEIVIVTRDTHRFNIAQYIYEFIGVAIPIVKRHPRFNNEEESEDEEDVKLIYQSNTTSEEEDLDNDNTNEDPRWALLKNLKNNLN